MFFRLTELKNPRELPIVYVVQQFQKVQRWCQLNTEQIKIFNNECPQFSWIQNKTVNNGGRTMSQDHISYKRNYKIVTQP